MLVIMKAATWSKLTALFVVWAFACGQIKADTLYVTDNNKVIEQFDSSGVGTLFVHTGRGPQGLAFDRAGNLFVANYTDGTIVKYVGGVGSTFASGLSGPWALA